MKNAMLRWMEVAKPIEKKKLAKLAGTTLGTLRFIAGSYRTNGVPSVRAELAAEIERGADKLREKNPKLPSLRREHLSTACAGCEFAKKCRE